MAIDLFNLGLDLGNALGTNAFVGGLILTLIVVMAIIIYPLYKKHLQITLAFFILSSALCVGLTWLNVYVFIIMICAVAGGLALKFKDIFT